MRNLKRALSLALASIMVLGLMVVGGSAASYPDVTSENNTEAIEVLKAVGIMTGDEKGNFNPDQNLTRNEMAVVMSNLMKYNVATYKGTSPFTDVPDWAEPYVAACYTNGVTSGTSATTYGGSDNVTTTQAALMIMKTLGYFQYGSDFNNDWELAAITQGNKIDLFDDVESPVRGAMTRNDLAQLVLNGLEAGTVEPEKTGNDIVVDGGAVGTITVTGSVKYNYITSSKDYCDAIESDLNQIGTQSGTVLGQEVVQLGEKLYQGDLTKKQGNDDFGRPASLWEYNTDEIGKYPDKADYTFTAKVTAKKLYDTLGSTVVNYGSRKDDDGGWEIWINGEPQNVDPSWGKDKLSVSGVKSDDDTDFWAAAEGVKDKASDNGVLTEIFLDGSARTVTVTTVNYYAAEVLKIDESAGTITLSDLETGDARTSDEFECDTSLYAEDDVVVYSYASDEIQEVYAATKVEGEVNRVKSNTINGEQDTGDSFVADGETYKYNKTVSNPNKLTTDNVDNGVVFYTDRYGYVVYIDDSATTYDYAYVLSMGTDGDKYGIGQDGRTVYARLVLTDGTMVKVETDEDNETDLLGHIVSYSKDKDDVYTLKDRSYVATSAKNSTNGDLKVENGVSSFKAWGADTKNADGTYNGRAKSWAANANTVFIVADPATKLDDYDFTVYTGVKNVPDIDGIANTKSIVGTKDANTNVARVVYIEDADTSGDDVIFIRADKNAKILKDSEIGSYYEINVYDPDDGEQKTVMVKVGSSADDDLISAMKTGKGLQVASGSSKYIMAAKTMTVNNDELVTSVRLYDSLNSDGDGFVTGYATTKADKDTVGLGKADDVTGAFNQSGVTTVRDFAWDDGVTVIRYNENNRGKMVGTRMSSVKTDENDGFFAVMDGNVITGLCVIDVNDSEAPFNGGSGGSAPVEKLPMEAANDNLTNSGVTVTAADADEGNGTSTGSWKNAKVGDTVKLNVAVKGKTVSELEDGKEYYLTINGVKCEDERQTYKAGSAMVFEHKLTDADIKAEKLVIDDISEYTGAVTPPADDEAKVTVTITGDADAVAAVTGVKIGDDAVPLENGKGTLTKKGQISGKVTVTVTGNYEAKPDKDSVTVDVKGTETVTITVTTKGGETPPPADANGNQDTVAAVVSGNAITINTYEAKAASDAEVVTAIAKALQIPENNIEKTASGYKVTESSGRVAEYTVTNATTQEMAKVQIDDEVYYLAQNMKVTGLTAEALLDVTTKDVPVGGTVAEYANKTYTKGSGTTDLKLVSALAMTATLNSGTLQYDAGTAGWKPAGATTAIVEGTSVRVQYTKAIVPKGVCAVLKVNDVEKPDEIVGEANLGWTSAVEAVGKNGTFKIEFIPGLYKVFVDGTQAMNGTYANGELFKAGDTAAVDLPLTTHYITEKGTAPTGTLTVSTQYTATTYTVNAADDGDETPGEIHLSAAVEFPKSVTNFKLYEDAGLTKEYDTTSAAKYIELGKTVYLKAADKNTILAAAAGDDGAGIELAQVKGPNQYTEAVYSLVTNEDIVNLNDTGIVKKASLAASGVTTAGTPNGSAKCEVGANGGDVTVTLEVEAGDSGGTKITNGAVVFTLEAGDTLKSLNKSNLSDNFDATLDATNKKVTFTPSAKLTTAPTDTGNAGGSITVTTESGLSVVVTVVYGKA